MKAGRPWSTGTGLLKSCVGAAMATTTRFATDDIGRPIGAVYSIKGA